MKYLYFLILIIEVLPLIEVKCVDPMVIRNGDPNDLAEGYSYERFNFLSDVIIDGRNVKDEYYWNTCSNYTGLNLYLKETRSEDCLGQVTDCTLHSIHSRVDPKILDTLKPNIYNFMGIIRNVKARESCHCLCNRLYDPKPHSSIPELLDSICLDEVMADVENNYVLTGVRLHRLNNTLTFEIQQGKIREGVVFPNTLQWVPPPKKCNKIGKMTASKCTLILDDVILSSFQAVTGVAFRRYSDIPQEQRRHPESLEVLEKDPFFLTVISHGLNQDNNLLPGTIVKTKNWNYTLEKRINLINDEMDVPVALMSPHHNHVLSKPQKNYVTFELSLPEQGLREFVVPYVDSQNVTDPSNFQYVKGIGLYYKGYEGYGGYIAPSIFVP